MSNWNQDLEMDSVQLDNEDSKYDKEKYDINITLTIETKDVSRIEDMVSTMLEKLIGKLEKKDLVVDYDLSIEIAEV